MMATAMGLVIISTLNMIRHCSLLFILLSFEMMMLGLILSTIDQWLVASSWAIFSILVVAALEAATGLALTVYLVRKSGTDSPANVSITK